MCTIKPDPRFPGSVFFLFYFTRALHIQSLLTEDTEALGMRLYSQGCDIEVQGCHKQLIFSSRESENFLFSFKYWAQL